MDSDDSYIEPSESEPSSDHTDHDEQQQQQQPPPPPPPTASQAAKVGSKRSNSNSSSRRSSRSSSRSTSPSPSLSGAPSSTAGRRALKRPVEPAPDNQLFKRQKAAFHSGYLDLLNQTIGEASARYDNLAEPDDDDDDDDNDNGGSDDYLAPSQVGLTVWSPQEKASVFGALARLGRDDVAPALAARLRGKTEPEVGQYLRLLRDALAARRRLPRAGGAPGTGGGGARRLPPLDLSRVPAALELSADCCRALDEAADGIAARQDAHEDRREQARWGDAWLVTPANARGLAERQQQQEEEEEEEEEKVKVGGREGGRLLPALALFHVSTWLHLSERVFMNSTVPEDNWQLVSGDAPSIRATALLDFYALARNITERLVLAANYNAMSRIRSKRAAVKETRNVVRKRDVQAAAQSLGLSSSTTKFWAGCARRMRLDVYLEPAARNDEGSLEEPLSYDELETALGGRCERADSSDASLHDEMDDSEGEEPEADSLRSADEITSQTLGDDRDIINAEANEILLHSAFELPETARSRDALKGRIASEKAWDTYLESLDSDKGNQEERRLWALLGRRPLQAMPTVASPVSRPPLGNGPDGLYPTGRDWRDNTLYLSEWEFNYAGHMAE